MIESEAPKSSTRQIVISEPDEGELQRQLVGRDLSPELAQFLTGLIKGKKWSRKINIPSAHDDLAAVLVFTSELKEEGLEIFSELHVFFKGASLVEKWKVMGEMDRTSSMPKEAFSAIEIEKVRADYGRVDVTLTKPMPGRVSKTVVQTFDFNGEPHRIRVVPHPLI